MSGTNFTSGLVTRKKYSGSTATTDNSNIRAATKLIERTAVIRCDAQASETQTNFTLPASAIVRDVMINVITVDATQTVDIGTMGTSNDPNGFMAAASLAVAGLVSGLVVVTSGVNEVFIASTTTGALLANFNAGTDAATDVGTLVRKNDITAGGDPISYTCSAGSDTAVFDIIIDYVEVVSEVN